MVQSVNDLSMKIELSISGRKLKDLDVFSKSDPQCMVYEMVNTQWVLVGKTEQLKNNLNPDFKTRIVMNYFFEKAQNLKFVMIDGDSSTTFDTIGEIQATIGSLMGAKA
jgi:hypothetical protein